MTDQFRFKLDIAPDASLLLSEISEPRNNDLRLVVVEAKPQSELRTTEVGLARPVRPDHTCRAFELTWYCYVAYSVRNESHFRKEDGEALGSEPAGIRQNSAYLEYVAATTFATNDHPGPLTHWFVYTEWHCIDVVSVDPPEVRQLCPTEAAEHCARFG